MSLWERFFGTEDDEEDKIAPAETAAPARPVIDVDQRLRNFGTINYLKKVESDIENKVKAHRGDHTLDDDERLHRLTIGREIAKAIERARASVTERLQNFNAQFLDNEAVYVPGQDERFSNVDILPDHKTREVRLVSPKKRSDNGGNIRRDAALGGPVGAVYADGQTKDGPLIQKYVNEGTGEEPNITSNTDITYVTFGDDPKLWEKEITTSSYDANGNLNKEVVIIDYLPQGQNGQAGVVPKQRTRFTSKNEEAFVKAGIDPGEFSKTNQSRELDRVREVLKKD
jgi:hypothetical protein